MLQDSIVRLRQKLLVQNYIDNPRDAWITDVAVIEGKNLSDPFHTTVSISDELNIDFPIGVHRAVGGNHDAPNPGDILCASLASCFESTLRMIANRLSITLIKTRVKAIANVDVRGTLMMDREIPVAFQSMNLFIEIEVAPNIDDELITKLLKLTEHCCIIFQTIKLGIPVQIESKILSSNVIQ